MGMLWWHIAASFIFLLLWILFQNWFKIWPFSAPMCIIKPSFGLQWVYQDKAYTSDQMEEQLCPCWHSWMGDPSAFIIVLTFFITVYMLACILYNCLSFSFVYFNAWIRKISRLQITNFIPNLGRLRDVVLQKGPKNTMDRKENQRMGLRQDWK